MLGARRSELDRVYAAGLSNDGVLALRESLHRSWKHEAATQRMHVPGECECERVCMYVFMCV